MTLARALEAVLQTVLLRKGRRNRFPEVPSLSNVDRVHYTHVDNAGHWSLVFGFGVDSCARVVAQSVVHISNDLYHFINMQDAADLV